MRFPFFRNRDSVKNGILISIRRTGDGFHPGLFMVSDRISIKEKFFYSIKFSTDRGYATSLGMNIYLWKEDIEDGASVMTVEYRPVEYGKDYDVVNNPDIFELYIDGKEVKE